MIQRFHKFIYFKIQTFLQLEEELTEEDEPSK